MEFEHGSPENPLKVSWLQGNKSTKDHSEQNNPGKYSSRKDAMPSEVTFFMVQGSGNWMI